MSTKVRISSERLKAARRRAGLTVTELAAAAGVHFATMQRLEAGTTETPRFATVLNIAEALHVSVKSLLDAEAARV